MDLSDEELITLLSVSPEFERAILVRSGAKGSPAIAALHLLGELATVARASLVTTRATPAPNPTPTPSRTSAPRPLPPVQAVSSHRAYRPALGDPTIVEALLDFHRSAAPAPTKPRPASPFASADPKRMSSDELEHRFPLDPTSKLLRARPKP
jgi:hypothetical protein